MKINIFQILVVAFCLNASNVDGGGKEKVHIKVHVPKLIKHHHHAKVIYVHKKDKDHGHEEHKKVEKKIVIHKHEHHHKHKHDHGHKHGHKHEHKHGHKHGHKHDHKHGHKHGHKHDHNHGHKHDHKHGHEHKHAHKHGHDHKHGHKHDHKHGHKHGHKHDHKHGHKHGHKHDHKEHKHHDHHGYSDDFDVESYQPQVEDGVIVRGGYSVEEQPQEYLAKNYYGTPSVSSYGSAYDGYSAYSPKLYDYDDGVIHQVQEEDNLEDSADYDYENEGGSQFDESGEFNSDYSESKNAPRFTKLPGDLTNQQTQPSEVSIQKLPLANRKFDTKIVPSPIDYTLKDTNRTGVVV